VGRDGCKCSVGEIIPCIVLYGEDGNASNGVGNHISLEHGTTRFALHGADTHLHCHCVIVFVKGQQYYMHLVITYSHKRRGPNSPYSSVCHRWVIKTIGDARPLISLSERGASNEERRNRSSHDVGPSISISTHSRSQDYRPSRNPSSSYSAPPSSLSILLLSSLISLATPDNEPLACPATHILPCRRVDVHPLPRSVCHALPAIFCPGSVCNSIAATCSDTFFMSNEYISFTRYCSSQREAGKVI
jgi:hypothetical protein